MDDSFPTRKQPSDLSASLQVFQSVLRWLVGLVQVTQDERRDAGSYLGDRSYG